MEDITVHHRNPVLTESICEPISLVDKTNLFVHGVQVMTIPNLLTFQVVFHRPIGGDDKDPAVVEVITEFEIAQEDDAK